MNKELLIELYLGKSLSTYKIAEIVGVHHTTVFGWLKKHNIPVRSKVEAWALMERPEWVERLPELTKTMNAQDIAELVGAKYHTVHYHIKQLGLSGLRVSCGTLNKRGKLRQRYTKAELEHQYCVQKLTLAAIGAEHGVTAATVLADMRRFGIERRTKTEASQMAWTAEMKEDARARAVARPGLKFGQQTDIERIFEEWATANNVAVTAQFQLVENGHRYDYYINGTTTLVELDGDYWHSSEKQQAKDAQFDLEAKSAGYTVIRILRSQIMKDISVFESIER